MFVLMAGVDVAGVLEYLCGKVQELDKRPISFTCFQYTLTINEALDADTRVALKRDLEDALSKVDEACRSAPKLK
jgi:hypothetical protein